MTGGTETEGFEPEPDPQPVDWDRLNRLRGVGAVEPVQQETGSIAQDGRRAAMQAWEASMLAATWYARPNDLIGGWCVMPSDEPPSSGGPEIADFCTERLARHIAELHNASLAGDQVTVSREDLRALLVWARMDDGFRADATVARLSAAAEVSQ